MSNSSCGIQLIDSASKTVFWVDTVLTIVAMIWLYKNYIDQDELTLKRVAESIDETHKIPWTFYIRFIMIAVLYAFVILFDGLAMDTVKDKNTRQGFSYVGLLAAVVLLGYVFYITWINSEDNITVTIFGMITAMIAISSIIFHMQIIVAAED